jgi:hypothetical protein
MPIGVTHILVFLFVHLLVSIILVLVLGFYWGRSGRVRTVYVFSLYIISLLSSRFSASALMWFSNFLKYLVFHFFISLSTVFIYRSSILLLLMYQGACSMNRRVSNWKRWRISLLELKTVPHSWIPYVRTLKVNRRFGGICRLYLQFWRIREKRNQQEACSKQSCFDKFDRNVG